MASRVTQTVRAVVATQATAGGAARVTQDSRVIVVDIASYALGGLSRVTQVSRVVICTVQPIGGYKRDLLRGMI